MSMLGAVITILVVDDHALFREGLRQLINAYGTLRIVGEAATGTEACERAEREQPDIVLLDLDLGTHSGLDALPELLRRAPRARVIVLTGVRDPVLHRRAVSLGAAGLVRKEDAADVMARAIEKVHAGEVWLEPTLIVQALAESRRSAAPDLDAERISSLTRREREVISLLAQGLRNRQIGERLFISETTIRHHFTSIFSKLGVRDRLELTLYALKHGLAKPSEPKSGA